MKKRTHIVYYIAALLAFNIHISTYGQCDAVLVSTLENGEAIKRLDLFKQMKTGIYQSQKVKTHLITIAVDSIKTVLNKLKSTPVSRGYDGVRIYFLRTDNDDRGESEICLLFVPTIRTNGEDNCKKRYSHDDETNVFLLKDGKFTEANLTESESDYIYRWKNNYNNLLGIIKQQAGIDDTKSIWYAEHLLYVNDTRAVDLLSFLDSCKSVTDIEFHHGCWTFDPQYKEKCNSFFLQTDLIFKLRGIASEKAYFTLGGKEIEKNFKSYQKDQKNSKNPFGDLKALPQGYTDTGLPCPPNKCD